MAGLFPSEEPCGYVQVAVERAVDRYPDGLTYAIPPKLDAIVPGQRVLVPLGKSNKPTPGYVVERRDDIDHAEGIDSDRIKPVEKIDDSAAVLPGQLMELAKWISGYYCCPIGMTLAGMLPAAVKRNIGAVTKTYVDLPSAECRAPRSGDEASNADEQESPAPKPTAKQRKVLRVLSEMEAHERPVELRVLAEHAGLKTISPVKRLIEHGLLEAHRRTTVEAIWTDHAVDPFVPERLTPQQEHVLGELEGAVGRGYSAHLLYGVTGAGKTEVYIRLIERILQIGPRSAVAAPSQRDIALMLVPEISLTPQTAGRLIGRFADERVAVLHSGLTAAQRHQQWALVAAGQARVVLGARSAVFAPIPDGRLGLIVVDEEHDGSYKQDQQPRYHGRDVAVRRGQLAGCPVLLGSATPSLESWYNATVRDERARYRLHRLPQRVPGMRLPHVQIVDFAEQRRIRSRLSSHPSAHSDERIAQHGTSARPLKGSTTGLIGPLLEQAIAQTLEDEGQVLILLNRRGFAGYVSCADQTCGWVMTCDHCDVTMVQHRLGIERAKTRGAAGSGDQAASRFYVRCHHCLTEQKLPEKCPQCGKGIIALGFGTQRVEEELAEVFGGDPFRLELGKTMLRIDSDSMYGARDLHDALGRFASGEVRVLLGTQMIAKGLDFPQVRLVGVINADTAINLPDFRANERTFQLVSQVAGRCGRSDKAGRVIVQTFHPDSPAIQLAAQHDYLTFARGELAARQHCRLPPWTRMARIILRNRDPMKVLGEARRMAGDLRQLLQSGAAEGVRVRGPAPCPIARIADFHRHQIELFADSARAIQAILSAARDRGVIRTGATMAVDVDPIALL